MSRSVTIPTRDPLSITSSAPILHSAICFAAAWSVSVLLMLKHSRPLMLNSSLTFIETPYLYIKKVKTMYQYRLSLSLNLNFS